MIKKILLVADVSSASVEAKRFSIKLAKRAECHLTGLGILDTHWMTAAQPEPLGGGAFKIQRDEEVIRSSHTQVESVLETFKKECEAAGVNHDTIELEGYPASEIERLSQEYDMIVMGQKTDFHFELDDDSDLTVKHVARNNPRPILAVPGPTDDLGDDVLVAYDGSPQSARALHMFLLLGLGKGRTIHIVTVDRDKAIAKATALHAQRMCELYDLETKVHSIATRDDPADVIMKKKKELPIGIVVVGSFSHGSLTELFFGSCASKLMKKSRVPLFIHH